MKTIIWKELRQCGKYVPAGLVVMSLATWYTLHQSLLIFDSQNQWPTYAALIGSVFALGLGTLQCLSDKSPAARALLMHRNTSAANIFWGKFLAGVLMFLGAMVPPLLWLMVYFAIDDRQTMAAHPSTVLPGLLGALAGFMMWPVAALLVHGEAKFFGSRFFPLVAYGSVLIVIVTSLDRAGSLIIFCLLAVLLLAVITFIARQYFINSQSENTAPRLALWIVNAFALILMAVVGAGILGQQMERPYSEKRYDVSFGPNAEPWLMEQSTGDAEPQIKMARLSTEGSVRESVTEHDDWTPNEYFRVVTRESSDATDPMIPLRGFSEGESANIMFESVFDNIAEEILVYRNRGHGHHLVRTLKSDSIRFGRYVGQTDLLHWTNRHQRQLIKSKTDGVYNALACDHGLFLFDDQVESVIPLLEFPPESSVGRIMASVHGEQVLSRSNQSIRVNDEVVLVTIHDAENQQTDYVHTERIQIPTELRQFDSIDVTRSPDADDEFIGLGYENFGTLQLVDIVQLRFGRDGDVLERTMYREMVGTEIDETSVFSVTAFVPVGVFAIAAAVDSVTSKKPLLAARMWKALLDQSVHWIWLIITAVLGIVVAFLVAMRRELSARTTIGWCLAGALFGPFGALAILSVYPRINRQPCAACGKLTRVDKSVCQHCGIEESELPRRGIEIFDGFGQRAANEKMPLSALG